MHASRQRIRPPAPVAGPEIRKLRRDIRRASLGRQSRPAGACARAGADRQGRHAGRSPHRPPGAITLPSTRGDRTAGSQGAFFRSLLDPIDTASPQGKFTLQVLGAAAEFERALIRERTKAGLASARNKGRVGGNPGLRAKDPAALRKVRLARQDGYMERLNETAQDWVPHVRRLRPDMAWEDVLRIVNAPCPKRVAGRKAACGVP